MNIETLLDAVNCSVSVTISGLPCHTWSTDSVANDPDNEVLYLGWMIDFQANHTKFTEDGLSKAVVDGNTITVEDFEGDPYVIALFKEVPLIIDLN